MISVLHAFECGMFYCKMFQNAFASRAWG